MKYKAVYWIILKPFVGKYLKKHFDKKSIKTIFKNAKAEYKDLLNKADDIGSDNPMASNLYFALLFLSFLTGNREKFTESMLVDMMESILNSPVLKKMSRVDLNNEADMNKLKSRMSRCAENSPWPTEMICVTFGLSATSWKILNRKGGIPNVKFVL